LKLVLLKQKETLGLNYGVIMCPIYDNTHEHVFKIFKSSMIESCTDVGVMMTLKLRLVEVCWTSADRNSMIDGCLFVICSVWFKYPEFRSSEEEESDRRIQQK